MYKEKKNINTNPSLKFISLFLATKMVHIIMKNILNFLILSTFILQTMAKHCIFSHEYEVHIVNYLPPGSKPLLLHCASGDDDLGNHALSALNQEFYWSFCESLFHRTLFFCHLRWGSKHIAFDVYRSVWRDRCSSRVCTWAAMTDGIYFSGDNPIQTMEQVYSW